MLAKALSFCVWTLVAFGCMGWGVRLGVTSRGVPPQAVPVGTAVEVAGDWSRLLGVPPPVVTADAVAPEQSSRYKLAGVMAPRLVGGAGSDRTAGSAGTSRSSQGVALISVDGKPPRAFLVGARVDGDVRLQSVGLRMASLGPIGAGGQVVLELPPLTSASTSTLPAPAMSVPATAMPGYGAAAPVPPSYPMPGMPMPPQFQPGNMPRPSEAQ